MPVSRRTFLRCAGALPIAALGAPELFGAAKPRVAVVGAGAFGGWTALHLRNHGCDVVLLDEWGAGNMLSSSGGKTRVIRAIYGVMTADVVVQGLERTHWHMWDNAKGGALWLGPLVQTNAFQLYAKFEDAEPNFAVRRETGNE